MDGVHVIEPQEIEAIYVKTPTPLIHYMLAVLVMLVQQFSGVNAILLFACGPLHAGFGYASHDTFIVLSSLQLVTTAVAAQLLDVVGRLKPLAVSVVVSTGSVMALGGVYFGVSHDEPAFDAHLAARITVVCKVIFTIGFSLGLGPASWALAVELAPLRNNGFEFGSVCAFHWASALAIISMFSIVGTTTASLALLVFLSAAVTFAGGMTALKLLPDTRCVSLEGILLRGQAEGTTRRASDIMDALKPPDALQQMTKTEHEDHKPLRGEHKRHQPKEEAHHSAGRLSATSASKSKAKAHAKSTAKPQATAEPRAKPEARAKDGAVEAVASREAEVKSGMLRTETPVVSPVEEAPEKQEISGSDEEEQP
ncbi:facilitated trehalose transporter Tret1-like [Dermacentor silvarum]|uniref:facilitated trehalose transporter Tret1-like n=1 Tax=Dermacentor silvarum TaxID=543639 RepID=UPI0018992BA8|nr:facilitated trehalose transporter Tret1-like [Dermacentor silvarum]